MIPSSIGASSHHSHTTSMIRSRIISNHHNPLHRGSGSSPIGSLSNTSTTSTLIHPAPRLSTSGIIHHNHQHQYPH